MPQTNFVKWIITDYEYFHAMVEKDPATLYFLKDTLEIYKGEEPYTRSAVKLDSADAFPEYGGNTLYIYDNKLYMHNGLEWEVVLDATGTAGESTPVTVLSYINPDNLTGNAVSDKAVVDYVNSVMPEMPEIPEVVPDDATTVKTTVDIVVTQAIGKYIEGEIIPKGTSIQDIIDALTTKPEETVDPDEPVDPPVDPEEPETYTQPTLAVAYSPDVTEVVAGEQFSIMVAPTFTQNDGGAATTMIINVTNNGVTEEAYNGVVGPQTLTITPVAEHNVVIDTAVMYAAGANVEKVPAGTLIASKTIVVTAAPVEPEEPEVAYAYFTADTNKGAELTPEVIVAFNKVESTVSTFEVDCVTDANRVVIAVPSDRKVKKITSSNLGYNVLTTFTQSTIAIDESTEYNLYVYETDIPFPSDDIYEVTLA